ncbi:MAG: phage tail tube protein [Petrotogales bacterium]
MSEYLGYVGWVRFSEGGDTFYVRATDADLHAAQTIDKPDVVDGKMDKTVWQLGPLEVEGSVNFPGVYEVMGNASPVRTTWEWAIKRQTNGRMYHDDALVTIKYVDGTGFEYTGCGIDSYEFSITQGDALAISLNIVGKDRVEQVGDPVSDSWNPKYEQKNTRIITWNDIYVNILLCESSDAIVDSAEIREFTCTVANNITRYYTLNGKLAPCLVLPTKRDITGVLTLMGRNDSLADLAYQSAINNTDNRARCTGDHTVEFGYKTSNLSPACYGGSCGSNFIVQFDNCCVFEIEEMSITNELFETNVNWHALPGVPFFSDTDDYDTTFLADDYTTTPCQGGICDDV